MHYYVAVIDKDEDSDYGVVFPDFPGCVTAGATIDEAIALASEALAFHVAGLKEDGIKIPMPRSLDKIQAQEGEWFDHKNAVAIMVPLLPRIDNQSRPVNLSLDSELVDSFRDYAEKSNMTMSRAFAKAARLLMEVQPPVNSRRRGKAA